MLLSLSQCVAGFLLLRLRGRPNDRERAHWLHRSCKLVLRRMGFAVSLSGEAPSTGLLVSNHLSYLDILIYGAALPCIFVSKTEVRSWPMLGLLAALGGTVFIDRGSKVSAAKSAVRIQELLAKGIAVLVFPEGTSSDGSGVLPFYPSLFEPSVRTATPVTAAAIGYSAAPFADEKDLCYYGDISFAPHLLRTLQLPAIFATIRFAAGGMRYTNRKEAATAVRNGVVQLRAEMGHAADTVASPLTP